MVLVGLQVMLRVQATELMWFLFYVYVPVGLLLAVINAILATEKSP